MNLIKWMCRYLEMKFSNNNLIILKHQCKHLYKEGRWSESNKIGWACLRVKGHPGKHFASVDTKLLDETK